MKKKKCKSAIGKAAVQGIAEGDALVLNEAFSYMEGANTETGEFEEEAYPTLKGFNMKGRIMVYPFAKGSTGDCIRLWRAVRNNVGPAGIINIVADPILVQGALLSGTPMVYNLPKDFFGLINTGDRVRIVNDKVTVMSNI